MYILAHFKLQIHEIFRQIKKGVLALEVEGAQLLQPFMESGLLLVQ